MSSTKDIKRRIKSVANIKKITKAMEMVAASKMRRAIEQVLKTRTYANLSWETILNLSQTMENKNEPLHLLLAPRKKVKRVGIVLITSNRGLCGGFNTAIINKVKDSIEKHQALGENIEVEAEFVLMGKKGLGVHKHGHKIVADFVKLDLATESKEVVPVAKIIIDEFLNGYYDKVMVAYTDFVNSLKHIPRVKQILPVDIDLEDEYLGVVGKDSRVGIDKEFLKEKQKKHKSKEGIEYDYIFEPSPKEVLDEMIPRLIEVQLYQALLESNASEHSARMTAMHQATDAAEDLVDELNLYYNKARQAGITSELAEISAGAAALDN